MCGGGARGEGRPGGARAARALGREAATSLVCAGAGEDAFARRGNPNAAAVLRVLVAATRAAEACAAAGGGAPSSAASSSGVSPRCRVPELRDARAACAALADTFRACVHAFAEAFGAEQTRRALLAEEAPASCLLYTSPSPRD